MFADDVPDHLKQYVPEAGRHALIRTFTYQVNVGSVLLALFVAY